MSRKRISSHGRKTSQSAVITATTKKLSGHQPQLKRFIGISLSGGKADKACVAVLEFYPEHKKIFLTKIFDKIKNEEKISADLKIHELVAQYGDEIENIAIDVPFRMPLCQTCVLKCPGYEACSQEHIQWMWKYSMEKNKKKKPRKIFTPYTQRCVELYLSSELEEPFIIGHALGSNTAPLLARAAFLKKRLDSEFVEVFPKLTLWRIGRSLNVMKSHLRFHKHAVTGHESRRAILKSLNEHNIAFVYDQDVKLMIENNHAFEAFICALTGFLKFQGQTQDPPKDFPTNEDWIAFPRVHLSWRF